jgi:hypothetical protein
LRTHVIPKPTIVKYGFLGTRRGQESE